MSFTMTVIIYAVIGALTIAFFVALYRATDKDWEEEADEKRQEYYDKILKRNKE